MLGSIQISLRDVLNRLRPYEGLELGLARALEMLLAQWQARFGNTRFKLRVEGEPNLICERVQDAVYRIVQEAVSNAVRHSRPSSVTVSLRANGETVEIGIENDGRVAGRADSTGFGLQTMRERAVCVGGILVVEPGHGAQGWHVRATLPRFESVENNVAASA
jgi:two-component system sensor histidine kinase UhpB